MTDIKSMTLTELKEDMAELSEKSFRAGQLYDWMHKKRCIPCSRIVIQPCFRMALNMD